MSGDASLQERREAVVREHMASENRRDFDATIATFDHPRYELVATSQVHDGEEEVRAYFAATRTAFPDQRNELVQLHQAADAVVTEFDLLGTHLGRLGPYEPTGRSFRCRMIAVFVFAPGTDRIVAERVYWASATILGQLGLIGRPTSPADG
jgi:steroid delta-isomerase-like uncharacterized protein